MHRIAVVLFSHGNLFNKITCVYVLKAPAENRRGNTDEISGLSQ